MHSITDNLLRALTPTVERHLKIMPAVVVTGARQSGKTTLTRDLIAGPRRFLTMDDPDVRVQARLDPDSLLAGAAPSRPPVGFASPREPIGSDLMPGGSGPLTLDEIQREPDLLHAIKRSIDEDRRAGRFLLTGSADLLLMRQVSESLAGRASYLTLRPMTRRELGGAGRSGAWDDLLRAPAGNWPDIVASQPNQPEPWPDLALRGGFPVPAAQLASSEERAVWFGGYVRTYLERDLHDLSAVWSTPDFRRLMAAAGLAVGQTLNAARLSRDLNLSAATVSRHLKLLEASHLLVLLPAYTINQAKRLIKSPKIYWADTGLALHLSREPTPRDVHLANLILCDLLAFSDVSPLPAEVFHWRTTNGEAVDFVLEHDGRLLPVEINTTTNPRIGHGAHLRIFRREYGDRSLPGLLVHCGDQIDWLTSEVLAVPWWKLI